MKQSRSEESVRYRPKITDSIEITWVGKKRVLCAIASISILYLAIYTTVRCLDYFNEGRNKTENRNEEFDNQEYFVDVSRAFFKSNLSSRSYGKAGGVQDVIFGKLPELNSLMKTEPNESQADYLRFNCGVTGSNFTGKEQIQIGKYLEDDLLDIPWMVQIVIKNMTVMTQSINDNIIVICGGVIINSQWVISAYHCFSDFYFPRFYVAHKHRNVFEFKEIEEFHFHPDYDDTYNQNDVVLLKVKNAFPTDSFSPACLPNVNVIPEAGRVCLLTGLTSGAIDKSYLIKLWVMLDDPNYCQLRYYYLKYDVNKNICDKTLKDESAFLKLSSLSSTKNKGICKGLSGNPLMCHENGRWVVYGILNWTGSDCKVKLGRGYALLSTKFNWLCKRIQERNQTSQSQLPQCKHVL